MKFLADENFPGLSVLVLREAGFETEFITETNSGWTDLQVMEYAVRNDLTILTFDKDYGELVFLYGHTPKGGVVFFRMDTFLPDEPAAIIIELIENNKIKFVGMFTVIDSSIKLKQREI